MATLRLPLRPSPILAVVLALLHGLALAAAAASLEGWALGLAAAGICLSSVGAIGEALQRWPGSALELELGADGVAAWRDRRGARHQGVLCSASFVSSWLLIVAIGVPGARRRHLVLPPDAAAPGDLRRLRQFLRWQAAGTQNTRDAQ
ncbi:MAG: hypothetical protein HYU75_13605 [Betaproteobacteria bacterium]|nr:hypothetical protein [Betaproteobacteria bacterium]